MAILISRLSLFLEIASALQAVSPEARKSLGLVDLQNFYVFLKKNTFVQFLNRNFINNTVSQ